MPVIDKGEILGIVNSNELADSAFSISDFGGKKGFIHNITGRKGIPLGTIKMILELLYDLLYS